MPATKPQLKRIARMHGKLIGGLEPTIELAEKIIQYLEDYRFECPECGVPLNERDVFTNNLCWACGTDITELIIEIGWSSPPKRGGGYTSETPEEEADCKWHGILQHKNNCFLARYNALQKQKEGLITKRIKGIFKLLFN